MKDLVARLERYWFTAMPPSRLALLRILVGAYALYYVGSRRDMMITLAGSPDFLFRPVGVFRLFDGPLVPEVFGVLVHLTLLLNVLFILGWKQRFVGPAFGILLLVIFCYRNSWSMIYHSHNVLVLHALVLGFSRSADAFSVDAWLRRASPRPSPHGQYGWAVSLMCVVTVCTYLLAGIAKIMSELGWAWAGGISLRDQIAVDAIRKEVLGSTAAPLAYSLYDYVWLFTLLGVGSLILELGAPVALLRRRWAYGWVLAAFTLHWGILFVMGIKFRYQLSGILFASFLPLELAILWGKTALYQVLERMRPKRALGPRTP